MNWVFHELATVRAIRFLFRLFFLAVAAAALTTRPALAATQPIRILALGDSLTQGYGLPPGTDFPTVLERTLKARGLDVVVVNAGVSGDTTAGGRARLGYALADPNGAPDAAIVELGANDGLRGLPVPQMEKNLEAILTELKARKIPVLLSGMKAPRNLGAQYAAEYDAVFPRLANKYGLLLDPFFLEHVALEPSLVQPDGLHPNAAGVEVIVKRITPIVVQLVQTVRAQRSGVGAR